MSLDVLVKISQILTPLVLVVASFLISRSLNKQANNIKLMSNFNLKWVDVLIEKCVDYSGLVTRMMIGLQLLSEEDAPSVAKKKEISILVNKLRHAEYDIQIHLDLVDGTSDVGATVNQIFNNVGDILKNKQGSINNIKALQSKLNAQLKQLHKSSLKL